MEKALNGFTFVLESLGLQYFSLKSLNKENFKNRAAIVRKLLLFTFLVVGVMSLIAYLKEDSEATTDNLNSKNVLMFTIQRTMNIALLTMAITCFIQSYVTRQSTRQFFFNFKEFVELSSRFFQTSIDFIELNRKIRKTSISVLTFFVIVHCVISFLVWSLSRDLECFVVIFLRIIPYFLIIAVMLKFVFFVTLVNNQLEFLRKILQNLLHNYSSIIPWNNCPITIVETVKKGSKTETKLLMVRKLYNMIHENSELVNRCNGLTILALIIATVTALVYSGYEIFVMFIGEWPIEKVPETIYGIILSLLLQTVCVAHSNRTCQLVSEQTFYF